ncbi:MAG: hypothetical protein HUU06_09120 [Planctomycetaceae bacterium]|nr:hypothetical protein [Planctomycetota bacterium]NUN52928.1 hypothetical protein [Planctomycetaceae bacterium]
MDPSRWTDDPEDDFGMQWTSPRIPREGREPCDIRISIDPPFLPPELHPYDFKPRHQALFNKDGSFVLVLTVPMGRNLGGAKGARQQWAEWTRGPYEIRWRAVPKPGP